MTVAALFVDAKGIYTGVLPNRQCWTVDGVNGTNADARLYPGCDPVVAHPPCNLWVNMASVNWKRYGRQRPAWYTGGTDGGCFVSALKSVMKYGGVLEHPASSHAWAAHELAPPALPGWSAQHSPIFGAYWVCEVWQHAYGHGARKRTWLLYCGARPPFELNWERNSATVTHCIGHDAKWRTNKIRLEKRHASATPEKFARTLIALAEHSTGK